jgi:phosphoserine aminotransferase
MIILSPRAIERLETFTPDRPLPKIFRLTKKVDGRIKINQGIFKGNTINTPSMLCVEDYVDALNWVESIGGLDSVISRSRDNLKVIEQFCEKYSWIQFLANDKMNRSNTSVCLTLDLTKAQLNSMVELLEKEKVAYDINSYRDSPPGIRIWCGATVEKNDILILTKWIEWAYNIAKLGK